MATNPPRVVLVHRPSEYDALIARQATHAQAAFFLSTRHQDIDAVRDRHEKLHAALHTVDAAVPGSWRMAKVMRESLDRFAFEPEDIAVVIGQDGLVANTAKYLQGQPVIGINPDPERNDGVLVPHAPVDTSALLQEVYRDTATVQKRTMVAAYLDDGQMLTALNEVFVGVRSHQSARYRIRFGGEEERQSSSGVIVTTGTGATGWARSINRQRAQRVSLPRPEDRTLAFFVREAFPSVATGTHLCDGCITARDRLDITSENNEGGVIFGDGIESDYLAFDWGQRVRVEAGEHACHMVVG